MKCYEIGYNERMISYLVVWDTANGGTFEKEFKDINTAENYYNNLNVTYKALHKVNREKGTTILKSEG